MEVVFFLFLVFIAVQAVRAANRKAKHILPQTLEQIQAMNPQHVRQIGAPAGRPSFLDPQTWVEESTSEGEVDELAFDHDVSPAYTTDEESTAVVRGDSARWMAGLARATPAADTSTLEHEVDWTKEHDLFHKRYVDARTPPALARQGVLDGLRDPTAVRRAVLMSEILGPPRSRRHRH